MGCQCSSRKEHLSGQEWTNDNPRFADDDAHFIDKRSTCANWNVRNNSLGQCNQNDSITEISAQLWKQNSVHARKHFHIAPLFLPGRMPGRECGIAATVAGRRGRQGLGCTCGKGGGHRRALCRTVGGHTGGRARCTRRRCGLSRGGGGSRGRTRRGRHVRRVMTVLAMVVRVKVTNLGPRLSS